MSVHTSLPAVDDDHGAGRLVFGSALFLLSGRAAHGGRAEVARR